MFVVTENDLDTSKPKEWTILCYGIKFGAVKQTAPDKFVLYRVGLNDLMEIATFPSMESLQRSLSNIEGLEYAKSS